MKQKKISRLIKAYRYISVNKLIIYASFFLLFSCAGFKKVPKKNIKKIAVYSTFTDQVNVTRIGISESGDKASILQVKGFSKHNQKILEKVTKRYFGKKRVFVINKLKQTEPKALCKSLAKNGFSHIMGVYPRRDKHIPEAEGAGVYTQISSSIVYMMSEVSVYKTINCEHVSNARTYFSEELSFIYPHDEKLMRKQFNESKKLLYKLAIKQARDSISRSFVEVDQSQQK